MVYNLNMCMSEFVADFEMKRYKVTVVLKQLHPLCMLFLRASLERVNSILTKTHLAFLTNLSTKLHYVIIWKKVPGSI